MLTNVVATIAMIAMVFTGVGGNVTRQTEIINANAGTKTVITRTASSEYEQEFIYNSLTNEWEEK